MDASVHVRSKPAFPDVRKKELQSYESSEIRLLRVTVTNFRALMRLRLFLHVVG
jgi:hypothetical protein